MPYLIDTSVLIDAKNLFYMFEFCPAFWDRITEKYMDGKVYSVRHVKAEIMEGKDELTKWAAKMDNGFFIQPNDDTNAALTKITNWTKAGDYTDDAKYKFYDSADLYLVAEAYAGNHTVVTREVPEDAHNRIKLPNACAQFDVRWTSPFKMLRDEKALFVLGKQTAGTRFDSA